MRSSISIFNDVLGPVMRGPSSSHTAGAYRIALVARALLGGDPASVRCTFDPEGSYAPTYKALGVDMAVCAGSLGWELTDDRYESVLHAAREAGVSATFAVEPLAWADHPNAILLELVANDGAEMSIRAASPGGGAIDIQGVDDWPVHIYGRTWDVVAQVLHGQVEAVREACREAMPDGAEQLYEAREERAILHWQSSIGLDEHQLRRRCSTLENARISTSSPIFFPQVGPSLFASASDALEIAEARECGLGELGIAHEMSLLELSEADVLAEMTRRYEVMRSAVKAGQEAASIHMDLTVPSAASILAAEQSGQLPLGGPQTRAAARALAVMHICNSRGVVCAAPTGGSAGVLPGVLSVLEEDLSADRATVLRALFAASTIGLIFASRATFAAEIAGCQVEIGVAGAMAAAAVVEATGGTARQALDAASIALQNTMGSVCDPVAGGCEIPCHTRNAAAAASAFTMADLIVGGYANPIPLDDAVDASFEVGKALPSELRCTARGGIAVSPSALRLCESLKEDDSDF